MNLDFLIKNGLIIDGTGNPELQQKDIGITENRINIIGDISETNAERIIDAKGFCICPGFIDTHSHSEFTLLADGRAEAKISQGITTEINGNCGFSAAPLYGLALEQREKELESLHVRERWNTFSEYFELLNKRRFAINFITLTGHSNLRASVIGYSDREPMQSEKEMIFKLLKDALGSGAIGLSTGLAYPPGIYSDTAEIVELAKETIKNKGRIYTTHLRDEGERLVEAIEEAIKIGLNSKLHVHISHLKTSGEKNWGKIDAVLEKIKDAQYKGLNLTADRYPYIAANTDLDAVLPSWIYEGGHKEELKRLENLKIQKKLKRELLKTYPEENYWDNIAISAVNSERNKWMEGKSLLVISKVLGKDPVECLFKILIDERLRVGATFFLMSEENLKTIIKLSYVMIGSDSSARCFNGITAAGKPHPRGFGSFPRILGRYVRAQRVITLAEAIHKMTGLPAKTFGIKQRGVIKEGFFADIVIFDPNKIKDKATFENPFEKPEGIHHVFVNGKPVLWEARITGEMPGRILT